MITLPFTVAALDGLKQALAAWLPQTKSSHRTEALARGIGFRTNAALRSAMHPSGSMRVRDERAFGAFLVERGFEGDPNILHRAFASAAIRQVAADHPRLTCFGFGIGKPQYRAEGRYETNSESYERFLRNQDEMKSEGFAASFLIAHEFLGHVPKTKTIRPYTGSYWLKHVAEKYPCTYPDGQRLGPSYVPNGALIAAAIHAGFSCKHGFDHEGYEHPNAQFNMPKSVLVDLDCECRPNGASAQERRNREWERNMRKRHVYPYWQLEA